MKDGLKEVQRDLLGVQEIPTKEPSEEPTTEDVIYEIVRYLTSCLERIST